MPQRPAPADNIHHVFHAINANFKDATAALSPGSLSQHESLLTSLSCAASLHVLEGLHIASLAEFFIPRFRKLAVTLLQMIENHPATVVFCRALLYLATDISAQG